jgi:hypothetical protein
MDRALELMGASSSSPKALHPQISISASMFGVNLIFRNEELIALMRHKDAALSYSSFLLEFVIEVVILKSHFRTIRGVENVR